MLHALLIDDEAAARADLRGKLAALGGATVIGEASTIRAARALLASADYDLVFLDVQLVGGESFLLVPDVSPGASIVFATAYDRYAVRAFESNAVDYLLKPIDPARLAEALRRTALAQAARFSRDCLASLQSAAPLAARSAICNRAAIRRLTAAPEGCREVALTGDERVFLRQCLQAWEDSLSPAHVLRTQTTGLPRTVRYERDTEPTRLFLRPPVSRAGRWWQVLRAGLTRAAGAIPLVRFTRAFADPAKGLVMPLAR